ncbi:MAG: tetratricopeptide repeat protein [Planctomycetota bacterium]|nr:tetratricopeptide repeat protein [Planctomycetota bacterium]
MKLRQEQIVFLVFLAIISLMTWRLLSSGPTEARGGSSGAGDGVELAHHATPDVATALPRAGAGVIIKRELFAPPSNTEPLPPLDLVEPPRAALAALLPPPEPGPAPRRFDILRRRVQHVDLPGLFAEVDTDLGEVKFEIFAAVEEKKSLVQDLKDLGIASDLIDLSPEERAALIEGYKQQYDWIWNEVSYRWGRIENRDRHGLKTDPRRAEEELVFTELDPETGAEEFRGMEPVLIEHTNIVEWDFAATVANRIEVRRREIGPTLARGTYDVALRLADHCVLNRLEATRALEIAEELYRLCAAFDTEDPIPRLGLARCFEAGFDFERAFAEYNTLVEEFGHRAEPHARLGALEARFRLFDRAEERLRQAVAVDRGSWEARWLLGRFLADRGHHDEALGHLDLAYKGAPTDPAMLDVRVATRIDLARAQLALGRVAEAGALFGSALSAAPENQVARAGEIATKWLAESAGMNGSPVAAEPFEEGAGFDLLLARGLEALVAGEHVTAKEQLTSAAAADPLRANMAWRALSFLAEITGFPGEAQRYIELALECDPADAWALHQEGRLFVAQEDYERARQSFMAALEQELDFEDALAALGEMAFRLGAFQDAERYLERAVSIDFDRVELYALRGLNFLLLGSVPDAREAFLAGQALERDHPVCKGGLAWCTYLSGESEEAQVLLRELDDSLRHLPADDPMRVWAVGQIDRIRDHEEKVRWYDGFGRKKLRNDWDFREAAGPQHRIVDGEVVVEGVFRDTGKVLLYRIQTSSLFVSIEADVWIEPQTKSRVGLFIARERARSRRSDVIAEASVSRHPDGSLQVRIEREKNQPIVTDMEEPFPLGQWVRLRIERTGDASAARVTLYSDGIPLVQNAPMASLGRATTPILIGLFVEGEPGRKVLAKYDNVEVVYRRPR